MSAPRVAALDGLDAAQRAAVVATDRIALVRAHVGSGKTTVLVHKLVHLHLVEGVPLDQIAVLTFTTQAAAELHARLDALVGRATRDDERWLMGTFHAVARGLLARALPIERLGYGRDFAVLDDDAHAALIAEVVKARCGRGRWRRRLDELDPDERAHLDAQTAAIRRARNAMSFDDLIEHATTLLGDGAGPRPRWILIDELQDCEPRELTMVMSLRVADCGWFGVGDPLQAIYGWRGGRDGFARAAAQLGGRIHELPFSYRSTRTVLEAARAVLGDQPMTCGAVCAARGDGPPVVVRRHHDPLAEAHYLAARIAELQAAGLARAEIAVLCRLRAQVDVVVELLTARGTPCVARDDTPADAVRVLTLHAAKGLEFRHVFIAGCNRGVLPLELPARQTDPAEERRLLYVGITRARDGVELSYPATPHQFGAHGDPSPLLDRLPAHGVEWHGRGRMTA